MPPGRAALVAVLALGAQAICSATPSPRE